MILIFLALIIVFLIGYSISVFFLADKAKKIEILPMAFVAGLIAMGYFILFASILTGNFAIAVWIFMALGGIYSAYFAFINFKKLKSAINPKELNTSFLIGKLKEISRPEIIFFSIIYIIFL